MYIDIKTFSKVSGNLLCGGVAACPSIYTSHFIVSPIRSDVTGYPRMFGLSMP